MTEVFSILNGMDEEGMIPNMIFAGEGRRWDPERPTFMKPHERSDYSQPPVLAQAVQETYQAMRRAGDSNAETFLQEIYPRLRKFYGYFQQHRQNSSEDQLIGVIHPHETGRDSDPTFDFFKESKLQNKLFPWQGRDTKRGRAVLNAGMDYAKVMGLNYQLKASKWGLAEARQIFWVNDIMFNCIYVDNLLEMAKLAAAVGRNQEADAYRQLASSVESLILEENKMWFPDARDGKGAFYALNKGKPIEEVSVSNLFPLLLPNLRPEQLESILYMLENSFDTDYPIASVPKDSPKYDPDNLMIHRLWRGGTWMNTNWYLVEHGLLRQAARPDLADYPELVQRCRDFANKVSIASNKMVDQGYHEYYHPETGQPQRAKSVTHFAWSTLARLLPVPKI